MHTPVVDAADAEPVAAGLRFQSQHRRHTQGVKSRMILRHLDAVLKVTIVTVDMDLCVTLHCEPMQSDQSFQAGREFW